MRYTTFFPLRIKGEVPDVLIPWIRAVRLQLRERFRADLRVLRLHFDRGVLRRPGCPRVLSVQQLREWYAGHGRYGGAGPCTYVLCIGTRSGEVCGLPHTTQRCFGHLTSAWRAQFLDSVELPRWHDPLLQNVPIVDIDFDAILAVMYAIADSAEGDCFLSVPPDPGIAAAALGARASATPSAGACAHSGTAPTKSLHTFTLDSGASRSFFRHSTTLTPLSRPDAVSLADPSGGPVLAHSSTVLPCPAAPLGLLSGLHLPSFSTKLVSGADLQDAWVDQFTPGGQRVTHCTCSRMGRHLATFTRRPGSSLYTVTTTPPPVSATGQAPRGGGAGPCTYVLRTGDRAGEQCGGLHSTQHFFGRLTEAWHHQFPDATEIPRWGDLSRAGVAIFDLDYDAILAAMYAVSTSDEGDCYLCLPPHRAELRWLTYLLTDLGEAPRSRSVLYVDNKAMLTLCQEHRLEHRTKHIALRYFLARELQQRGQLRLAYVASQADTAYVFTKALQPSSTAFACADSTPLWLWGKAPRGGGAGPCTYVLRTGDRAGEQCGGLHSTQHFFGRLTEAWHHQFPDATEIPRWGDLSRAGVAIFDLDYDAILAAMYAVSTSDEGDCARASAAPGAGESALSGTASAQVFHTFTLDSGASRSFFRDRTTLTPLSRPVAVSLADPSGGPVLASFSTVLPCPAAPSGTLSGLYLPSFSTNLVSGADLQDQGVDKFTPASQRVAASSQVFAAASGSGPESAPCSCRLMSHQTLLWHHRLGHPSLPRLRGMATRVLVSGLPRSLPPLPPRPAPTCVPCVEGRQRATPHSSEFPPTEAPLQTLHMDVWGPTRVRGQGHERYFLLVVDDFSRVLRLHSDRGGEFSSARLGAFCRVQGIRQTLTLLASPQQNGIAERRIGMVMDVARTSMIHAAAPHFLWPFAVQDAAHQLNLQPRVSLPETSPTLRWTDKLSPRAVPCVFLCFPPDAPGWQFYHPTSRRVLSSQDVTFDKSVPYYRSCSVRCVSESGGAEPGGAEPGGAESGGAEPGGAEPGGVESAPVASRSASSRRDLLSPQELHEWFARCWSRAAKASGAAGAGAAGGVGAGVGAAGASGAAGAGAAWGVGAGVGPVGGTAGATGGTGAAGPAGVGAVGAGGAADTGAATGGTGAVAVGTGGPAQTRPYFVPLLEQVLGLPPSLSPAPPLECPQPVQSQSPLQPVSPLPAPSPYAGPTGGLSERREPASRPASPVRTTRTSRCTPRPRPPAVPRTHQLTLHPSTAPLRVPLPSPPASSLPVLADPASDSLRAASPTVARLQSTVITDPSFESTAASSLVAELVDFAARCLCS
ncbi:unnamed protein product [Closterium sp. NIES-53]